MQFEFFLLYVCAEFSFFGWEERAAEMGWEKEWRAQTAFKKLLYT